jgi:enoyl-CoA hydratase
VSALSIPMLGAIDGALDRARGDDAVVVVLRQRLTPAALNRAAILAEPFTATDAVAAGFLDRVVARRRSTASARAVVAGLAALDRAAHRGAKAPARASTLRALRAAIDADVNAAAADLPG